MLNALKEIGFLLLFLRFIWWIMSSFTVKEGKRAYVLLAQLIEGFLALFFYGQLVGGMQILPFHVLPVQYVGFVLTCIGVGIAFFAKKQLGQEWVNASAYKHSPKETLVTSGVYSVIRHPIYAGIFLSYVGVELLAGSWLWISMLFFLLPFYFQAKKEEKMLMDHFGKTYKTYQLRTKMLIPYLL